MFSKNKLLLILFIFIIILSFFTSSFAVSLTGTSGDTYNFPNFPNVDDCAYYLVFYTSGTSGNHSYSAGYYFAYVTNNSDYDSRYPLYISIRSNGYSFGFDENPYLYYLQDGSWEFLGQHTYYNMLFSDFYFSSVDLYTSGTGELFFQAAPVTVEQVTIPEIQQVGEIPQVIAEVLKILIPIGLIVLSIGLVIYLTRLVISRLQ